MGTQMTDELEDAQWAAHVLQREDWAGVRLDEILPEARRLTGPIDRFTVPTSCRAGILRNVEIWEDLRAATPGSLLSWTHVGPGRAIRILQWLRQNATEGMAPAASERSDDPRFSLEFLADLGVVAAWAMAQGLNQGLEEAMALARGDRSPSQVREAIERIDATRLSTLAKPDLLEAFDPLVAATRVLERYEGRDREILGRLLANGLRPVDTLETLGSRHGVTRERIRQLEARIAQEIRDLAATQFSVLTVHAAELADLVGAACPVDALPEELSPDGDEDLTDELFAYLAGPFRLVDGWMIKADLARAPSEIGKRAFEAAHTDGVAPLDAMLDALGELGIAQEHRERLIDATPGLRRLERTVSRWTTHADKCRGVLAEAGRPMLGVELAAAIGEADNVRTIRNSLGAAFPRVGRDLYALPEWEHPEYRGIVAEMVERLQDGPWDLDDLAKELANTFGVSDVSVRMYAGMHPRFVSEGGMARLRRKDEPYVPATDLTQSSRCYQVDGVWALRVPVDRDVLRGSGRPIPEAFAVHLGLNPLEDRRVDVGRHSVWLGWSMAPSLGSTRSIAHELRLEAGDHLLLLRSRPSALTYRAIRKAELARLDEEQQLRLMVGTDPWSIVPLDRVLGEALGHVGSDMPGLDELRAQLARRREDDLVELLDRCVEPQADPGA